MSLLKGIRRLIGGIDENSNGRHDGEPQGRERGRATTPTASSRGGDDTRGQDPDGDERPKRRRRGRRGGRGRSRSGGSDSNGGSANADTGSASATADRERSDSGRSTSGRSDSGRSDNRSRGDGRRSRSGGGNGRDSTEARNEARESSRSSSSSRGRGGSSGGSSRGASSRGDWANGSRDRRGGEGRRRDDARGGERRGRRPWGRPRRDTLEPPLPEDVAFRPASEGGDNTLLPGRRRRPPGPKTTNRVVVSSPRHLPSFGDSSSDHPPGDGARGDSSSRGDAPRRDVPTDAEDATTDLLEVGEPAERGATPEPGASSAPPNETRDRLDRDEPAEADDDATDDDATEERPRRRGRRGGRGRGGRANGHSAEAGEATADAPGDSPAPADDGESPGSDEPIRWARAKRQPAAEPPSIEGFDRDAAPPAFEELGIGDRSLVAVMTAGFTEPTPVQAESIPLLLQGRDVVGIAQTGTGKTLAFGIPMMERIDPRISEVQALVLVPTRELAQQVLDVLTELAEPFGLQVVGLLGGRALERDFRALEGRPQVVVGTPGRIKDHLGRGTLSLRKVSYAILDEADQMLDIGFLPDITHILGRTPRRRQTALFSATMPTMVRRLVKRYMDQPDTVEIEPELLTVESIDQIYFEVAQRDKVGGLRELIERELRGRTLVFSRTKRGVDFLSDQLQGRGVRVGALHGDMDQRRRDRVVQSFRDGELDILIATNVAARGLDIPEITHVVNYDVPQNAEEYVHRIGRTGRAGREGKAITFVCEYDMGEFDTILKAFGDSLHAERLELYA